MYGKYDTHPGVKTGLLFYGQKNSIGDQRSPLHGGEFEKLHGGGHRVSLHESQCFFIIFKYWPKIEFLIFLGVLCAEWWPKPFSFDYKMPKKFYNFHKPVHMH